MEGNFELETRTFDISRGGKKVSFTIRELTADEYWSIQEECIDKTSEELLLNTHLMNLKCLSKAIKDPPMTMEKIAQLPKPISDRLMQEYKILNDVQKTFFLEESPKKEE